MRLRGPFLELVVLAALGEVAGAGEVLRGAVGGEGHLREGVAQALLDQADGEVGDVDADPLPSQLLRRTVVPQPQNGSSTTSPGLEEAATMRSSRATGFWVG
jgi:hypothetical protein